MNKIAVVILNWNGKSWLEQFMPAIIQNNSVTYRYDVFVIDNSSTDDSCFFLQKYYPAIKLIKLDLNYGFAGGYNKGLAFIDYKYYILLNSDVEVVSDWVDPLISYLDAHEDVAAVQPKILSQTDKSKFEYAGACGGFIDKMGFPFCRGRIFDSIEEDKNQYNTVRDVFWASGACLAVRASEFWKHTGFDEHFFAHMEEIDLCWRIWLAGSRVVCVPDAVVYHVGGGTLNEESPFKTYLNYRNNMLMLYKNLDSSVLKKVIFQRRIYNFIAAFKFVLSGKVKQAKAILKADRDFRKQKQNYESYRQNLKASTISLNRVVYNGNLIFQYFFKRKKLFDELKF